MVHKSLSLTLGQSFEHITLYTYNGAAIFSRSHPYIWSTTVLHNICAQLPSRLGMQLNFRLRSLYVLLLCLYVPYTCCYYSCNETLPAPGAPRGASACSRWRPDELHGCRLCTSDARRIRSITSFHPGRLTTAPT